jgi:hypothetical protein
VACSTLCHSKPCGSSCLRCPTASAAGIWAKRWLQNPALPSVRPAVVLSLKQGTQWLRFCGMCVTSIGLPAILGHRCLERRYVLHPAPPLSLFDLRLSIQLYDKHALG